MRFAGGRFRSRSASIGSLRHRPSMQRSSHCDAAIQQGCGGRAIARRKRIHEKHSRRNGRRLSLAPALASSLTVLSQNNRRHLTSRALKGDQPRHALGVTWDFGIDRPEVRPPPGVIPGPDRKRLPRRCHTRCAGGMRRRWRGVPRSTTRTAQLGAVGPGIAAVSLGVGGNPSLGEGLAECFST